MPIRLKKRFSRKVTNKKHKSKRSKSKNKELEKQRGGDEKFQHGQFVIQKKTLNLYMSQEHTQEITTH